MNFRHSPIIRLTLWYVLFIMVLSVSFSTVIYELVDQHVRFGLPPREQLFQQLGNPFREPEGQTIADVLEERYQQAMSRLRMSLLGLNVAVLAGSALASYFLAKRTLRPIEQALDDQRRFAADASHELRTPLTAMKTEIEVALQHGQARDHAAVLASTLEEVGKLETLSRNLLHLARHEDDRLQPQTSMISFPDIINEAVKRVGPMAAKRSIAITTQRIDGSIMGDEAGLIELFVVLLDNAVKYSAERSAVEIRGTWTKGSVSLAVKDHGIGIPAEDLPHVFQRFYRADRSRSKHEADGHGLGLSIAQKIVDRHHGTIAIASIPGEGTTVTVVLPTKIG